MGFKATFHNVKVDKQSGDVEIDLNDGSSASSSVKVHGNVKAVSIQTVSACDVVCTFDGQANTLVFESEQDAKLFAQALASQKTRHATDAATSADGNEDRLRVAQAFVQSRDKSAIEEYFQYYAHISQQQNMLSDYTRTSTYREAMLQNHLDFEGKAVLDVGAGTGLLSFFAAQAGARKVYAVEASNMADQAKMLVEANGMSDRITVIKGRLEDVTLPEKVDMIVSEPLGVMLVNERMLESYVHARSWLKEGGKMFPTTATMFICPFTDEALWLETTAKCSFWQQSSFHGIDLTSLQAAAKQEYFQQPVVEQVDPRCLVGEPASKHFDFLRIAEEELFEIEIPFEYLMPYPTTIHGVASWFDVSFMGSHSNVILSTAPQAALTHWYQVRSLLREPLFVAARQTLRGVVKMKINRVQSYDITIEMSVVETGAQSQGFVFLKEPNFRFGQAANTGMATEAYFFGAQPENLAGQQGNEAEMRQDVPDLVAKPQAAEAGQQQQPMETN